MFFGNRWACWRVYRGDKYPYRVSVYTRLVKRTLEEERLMKIRLQTLEDATRERTIKRLKIIEGQVRGVQGMIEEGRKCVDILMQVSAVQEGLRNVGKQVMRNYLENCATHAIREQGGPEIYDELMEVIYKYAR